ncbi:PAQR family membrane homeostasis protein TrhA [Acidovorax sp. 22279]|uniref:PAQR family membrane homeostasis protein TrhA n=1 Tax=Acidovorax sp. 22279 TaxID=3453900 RepID=UPI003F8752AD
MSDRPQDLHEEVANSALHGAALVGACLAVPQLLQSAPAAHPAAIGGVLVFVATMALLYGASTLYHALPPGRAKEWALRLDHAAIHLFIAGSFTPFALSAPGHTHHVTALALVWLAALAGCWLQLRTRRTAPWLSTALYVAMGWVALLAALPLMAHVPAVSAAWLVIGGAAYTAGVVFFVMDAVVRYAHAVWHGCVIAGTGCHVIAVLGLQAAA